MENVIGILGSISFLGLIINIYLLLSEIRLNFIFSNYYKLLKLDLLITFISGLLMITLSYTLYNYFDYIIILSTVWSFIYLILLLFNNNNEGNVILLKASEFSVYSDLDIVGISPYVISLYNVKNVLKTKLNDKDTYIVFSGTSINENNDVYVKYLETNEDGILKGISYKYRKNNLLSLIDLVTVWFVILTMVYGYFGTFKAALAYGLPLPSDSPFKYIGIGCGFFIFHFGYRSTKNGKDSFTKFWHFVSLIAYVICAITVLIILFS